MVKLEHLLSAVLLITAIGCNATPHPRADRVVAKVADRDGSYCHLKFPAIRKETLYWNRPVLTEPSEGDMIDFYGPCDHDPLGKQEVLRQRRHLEFERHLGFDDE